MITFIAFCLALIVASISTTISSIAGFGIEAIAIIIGVYELIIRIVPTVKDNSIIGNVLKILNWLSDLLNKYKT